MNPSVEGVAKEFGPGAQAGGTRITWITPTSSYDTVPSPVPKADGLVDAGHILQLRLTLEEAPESLAQRKDYTSRVQDAVTAHQDIDAIHIIGNWSGFNGVKEYGDSDHLWKALGGTNPSHVALESTSDRKSSLSEILDSCPSWYRLQSFFLSVHPTREELRRKWSFTSTKDIFAAKTSLYPECFKNLENLSVKNLHFKGFYFNPDGGATALRSLSFTGDQAINSMARTVFSNPEVPKTLQSLKLHSNGTKRGQARGDMTMVHLFLHECKALKKLDLILNDSGLSQPRGNAVCARSSAPWPWSVLTRVPYYRRSVPAASTASEPAVAWPWNALAKAGGPRPDYIPPYAGLHDSIPNTVTSLSFRGPPSLYMLCELDQWVKKANNPTWLPCLREIAFSLDLPNTLEDVGLTQGVKEILDDKVFALLLALGKRGGHLSVNGGPHIQQRLESGLHANRAHSPL